MQLKSNKSSNYKSKYEHITKHRGKEHVIIAAARLILTAI